MLNYFPFGFYIKAAQHLLFFIYMTIILSPQHLPLLDQLGHVAYNVYENKMDFLTFIYLC